MSVEAVANPQQYVGNGTTATYAIPWRFLNYTDLVVELQTAVGVAPTTLVYGTDFTAVSLGANFLEKKLAWSNRVEYRTSSTDNKWGLITGVMNEQGLYWGWTGKLQVLHSHADGGTTSTDADLRVGPLRSWTAVLDVFRERALDLTFKGVALR